MQLSMLLTKQLKPVPNDIKIVENFGPESCLLDDGTVADKGEVILISSTPESIIKWLSNKEIWVGNGLVGFKKEKVLAFPVAM